MWRGSVPLEVIVPALISGCIAAYLEGSPKVREQFVIEETPVPLGLVVGHFIINRVVAGYFMWRFLLRALSRSASTPVVIALSTVGHFVVASLIEVTLLDRSVNPVWVMGAIITTTGFLLLLT